MTALGLVMIASNITNTKDASTSPLNLPQTIEIGEVLSIENKNTDTEDVNAEVEKYVRNYFSDIPVLAEVAKCESRFRQFDKNGNVLRGVENKSDKGVMQINSYYHEDAAKKLGYNISTLSGNVAYARHLFEQKGVKPWVHSSKCWSKTLAYQNYEQLAMGK